MQPHQPTDFRDIIGPGENIEDRTWRCLWCGERAGFVGYTTIDKNNCQDPAHWRAANGDDKPGSR